MKKKLLPKNESLTNFSFEELLAKVKECLQKRIDNEEIPEDGREVIMEDEFEGTSIWLVDYSATIQEFLEECDLDDYDSIDDLVDDYSSNNIFLMEQPFDEFGGMPFGMIVDWKYL